MAVSLIIENTYHEMGSSSLLNAFFSTIYFHLVKDKPGIAYPKIFMHLYKGHLKWQDAAEVLEDFEEIRNKLKRYGPDKIIWDIQNLSISPPPPMQKIDRSIPLSNCFLTEKGLNYFDLISEVLKNSIAKQVDVFIR